MKPEVFLSCIPYKHVRDDDIYKPMAEDGRIDPDPNAAIWSESAPYLRMIIVGGIKNGTLDILDLISMERLNKHFNALARRTDQGSLWFHVYVTLRREHLGLRVGEIPGEHNNYRHSAIALWVVVAQGWSPSDPHGGCNPISIVAPMCGVRGSMRLKQVVEATFVAHVAAFAGNGTAAPFVDEIVAGGGARNGVLVEDSTAIQYAIDTEDLLVSAMITVISLLGAGMYTDVTADGASRSIRSTILCEHDSTVIASPMPIVMCPAGLCDATYCSIACFEDSQHQGSGACGLTAEQCAKCGRQLEHCDEAVQIAAAPAIFALYKKWKNRRKGGKKKGKKKKKKKKGKKNVDDEMTCGESTFTRVATQQRPQRAPDSRSRSQCVAQKAE